MALVALILLATNPVMAGWLDADGGEGALRQALSRPSVVIAGRDVDTEELNSFYAARQYRPLWEANPEAMSAFLSSVEAFADTQGLRAEDYKLDAALQQAGKQDPADKNADKLKLELLVTDTLFRLAHDLRGDDVDLAQLYPGWSFQRDSVDLVGGLAKAIDDNNVNAYISGLAPSDPAYARLVKELAAYREMAKNGEWPQVTVGGAKLKAGDRDKRIAQIRARLTAEGYQVPSPETAPETYDAALKDTVISYQKRNGLDADGTIGAKTIKTMNVPEARRIDQIIANMERWRHMPDKFPDRYALVNIADATITVFENGKPIYSSPVVVGRPDRKTPFIHSQIRSVIFNPSWHVPAKIARKDILPKLRKDPHYLEKLGFVINGSADDPYGAAVDWSKIKESAFNFKLRQSPGDMNSLGRIKFDFDNDFSVYLHGTPHHELFAKAERHLSSGCVRLGDPQRFAEIVLAGNGGDWDAQRVHAEVEKGATRWLAVTKRLPLYIVYWTAFAGDDDALNFRDDIYDYDEFLMENLKEADDGQGGK